MSPAARRSLALASVVLFIGPAGCGGKPDAAQKGTAAAADAAAAARKDGEPPRPPLTAKRLAPVIQESGVDGVLPTSIVIELAVPVVGSEGVNGMTPRSVLDIQPPLSGTLRWTGTSTLTFTPARPFEHATAYKVSLAKIDTPDGIITPPAGETWSRELTTPAFSFLRWSPAEQDLTKKSAIFDLTFSGPVLANRVKGFLAVTVDGKNVKNLLLSPTAEPHVLRLAVTDPRVILGAKVRLEVKKGLPALGDAEAPAATGEYVVSDDKAIVIKGAVLQEGPQGFYLEVICDDKAAAAGERSYYRDNLDAYGLSSRCELREDALARIVLTPAAKRAWMGPGKAGFRILGDFKRGSLKLSIPSGVTSVDGGVLLAPLQRSFSVPARRAQLSFVASGRYLPRSAWKELAVRHLNVEDVKLSVRHVPPENLIFWLGEDDSDRADDRSSNLILEKVLPLRGERDASATSYLDVAGLLPAAPRGVLELRLDAVGASATSRLLLTSMSLVAKKGAPAKEPWRQQVTVWALDVDASTLLDGVEMSLVRKSGKVVARCQTAGAKGCVLEPAAGDADPDRTPPFAILARKGDDLTYLRYRDLRTEAADANVAGAAYQLESPYRAAMWSDRGVYRPGDTAHIVALLRGRDDLAPPQLPVEVKLIDPRGKLARKLALKTNAAGLVVIDHAFAVFADTGGYRVELAVADRPVSQHVVRVEEFVPERMKVTLEARSADVLSASDAAFVVSAKYLFGGSAAGSSAELNCALEPRRFAPEENGELVYGVEPLGKTVSLGEEHGELDAAGAATIVCPPGEARTAFAETGTLTARVGVLEAGSGRATVQTASATVHPESYYIGLKADTAVVSAGRPFTVTGLIVDWKGHPLPGAVKEVAVETLHLEAEREYDYDEENGETSSLRHVHGVPEARTKAAVKDGRFTMTITPGDTSVGARVRVTAGRAVTELDIDGEYPYYADSYGESGGAVDQTPRPARPTRLALDAPHEIRVGEPVTVKLRAPYRGKILFAVETDRLVSFEWKDVVGGEVTWSFTPAAFAPNLYVSAFLIKDPHAESAQAYLPDRAFGLVSLRVAPVDFTGELRLTVPPEVRSSSPLTIKLDAGATGGPTFATVAVVDEGILSLTRHATPDPLAELFAKRALGIETYETIGWTLLHQPAGTSSRTGGGDDEAETGEGDGGGRVQPVRPVAFFVGPIALDASGKAEVHFDVPQYRGQLRVMAVTAGAKKVGRAEAKVTVKDPLVVQVTFPRFATHGDELLLPVFLTNLSGGPLDVEVALAGDALPVPGMAVTPGAAAAAPITFLGKDRGALKLDDGASQTVVFNVKAAVPVGAAKLRVVARAKGRAGSLEARDDVDVPFLPAGPRERIVHKLNLEAGVTDLAPSLRGWVPTSERTTFWLTSNPYGESFAHLKYLIHYPYGCVEQTTSSARPLLYVGNLVDHIEPQLAEQKLEDMVLAGINRLLAMQTPSGGLAYWPGENEPVDWGTAYATHFLLEAKKLGYAVPEERLQDIVRWIEQRVAQYESEPEARRAWYRHDEQAEAYLHYVLALAGKGKKARMLRLVAAIRGDARAEQAENLYMLKAGLYVAGDRRYEKDLRSADVSEIVDDRHNGWSFYSDRRRRGFMLSTYVDLFGKGPEGEALAQRVAGALQAPSYAYTTQELVWGVTALGKWVEGGAREFKPGRLLAGGKEIKPRPTKGKGNDRSWALVRASESPALTFELPEKAQGNVYLIISSEGVPERSDAKLGGDGLSVKRTYRALDGSERSLEDGSILLGDLVFVELEIENTTRDRIQNIAFVDRLPAGFEIENPRLGRGTTAEWIDEDAQWAVEFMNLRDDRLEAFGALAAKEKRKLVYTVRATTAGKYTIPPVEAEAMYDPTRWARDKARTLVITGPWDGKLL